MLEDYDFKILQTTNSGVKTLFFEGCVEQINNTPNNDKLIFISRSRFIKINKWISIRKTPKENMRIIVPKRRTKVMESLRYLKPQERYVFSLTRESRSHNFVLSEIYLPVTIDGKNLIKRDVHYVWELRKNE